MHTLRLLPTFQIIPGGPICAWPEKLREHVSGLHCQADAEQARFAERTF